MRKFNFQVYPHICQASVDRVKEFVLFQIIFWVEPFLFQFAPKRFGNIQVWTIRRKVENIQSSLLPIRYSFLDGFGFVYFRIIQDYKCCFAYFKRPLLQIFQNKLGVYIFRGHLPPALILSANEPHTVNLVGFFGGYANFFIRKLPSVRNIAFAAHMRFISVIKVYGFAKAQLFEFFEFFNLKLVMFCQRASFRTTSYTLISSAKLFKKRLKVLLDTFLPLCCSHSALAVCKRCRLALMAERTASLSLSSMIGLRPRPCLVAKPCKPSALYRLTHVFTLTWLIPVILPTSLEVRPSDLSKIHWQRIRKQWLLPSLIPVSNSLRCGGVSKGVLTRLIWDAKIKNNWDYLLMCTYTWWETGDWHRHYQNLNPYWRILHITMIAVIDKQ